ncbi:MAG: DUF1186 domain-containing protein [Ginsengibacter sp.]
MYSQYTISGYNITTDPGFQNEQFGHTQDLIEQFNELFIECQIKKNKKIIPRLTALILKYPQSPQLKNYLFVAYSVRRNYEKAAEINSWIITEHPDYLFGKLNAAHRYITNDQAQKVPGVLGEAMKIKALYPGRDLFHLAEVTGFFKVVIRYYAAINNLELAESHLSVLNEIAPDHPDTLSAESFLSSLRMNAGLERLKKEEAGRIRVTSMRPVPLSTQKIPPVFNHAEINNLYQYGIRIPGEKLKEIIALPRETVIADLEKIFQDAVERYQYFAGLHYEEEMHNFPLHALCLLAELKSEKSLPAIFNFLENNEEVLDLWFGDHLTATVWLPVYLLSQNNLGLVKEFLMKPGIFTYSKTALSEALCQMVLHQPEKRNEIVTIYTEILSYFNQASLEDNIIDSDFLGLIVGDIINCSVIELLPVIRELFVKKYVGTTINGSYDEVEEYLKNPTLRNYKNDIRNIFELYDDILKTWAGYSIGEDDYSENGEDDFEHDFLEDYEIRQPANSVKIGRNDPCPCGSDKKYKKCCKDKLPL